MQDDGPVDMDLDADEMYITASFLSDYKIEFEETDMHWWKFCTLLQGLTDQCILNRVRDLRNYDLSFIKDHKERNRIAKQRKVLRCPSSCQPASRRHTTNLCRRTAVNQVRTAPWIQPYPPER